MKEIFYRKIGRRYVPVAEYDQQLMDSYPKGTHVVICYPGGKSTRYHIDPNYASMIAAGRVAEDAICEAMIKASEIRPNYKVRQTPMTPEQKAAWEHLIAVFGENARSLEWPSTRDIAEAAINSMMAEADKLMSHAAVRAAFEQFLIVCELTKENKNEG